jgi:hypothetical protein
VPRQRLDRHARYLRRLAQRRLTGEAAEKLAHKRAKGRAYQYVRQAIASGELVRNLARSAERTKCMLIMRSTTSHSRCDGSTISIMGYATTDSMAEESLTRSLLGAYIIPEAGIPPCRSSSQRKSAPFTSENPRWPDERFVMASRWGYKPACRKPPRPPHRFGSATT